MVTAAPGWEVIPGTNQVRPVGSAGSVNNPNTAPAPTPSAGVITKTSTAPTPVPTPQPTYTPPTPTYTGPVNNSINNTPQGDALVASNQAAAAKLGITIPGVGGGSATPIQTQPTNQTQTPPSPTTFPGLINSLAQNSTTGSPIAGQAATGLINSANSNPLTSGAAYDTYSKAVSDYNTLKQQVAKALADTGLQPGVPLNFMQGQQQVIAQRAALQLDAAAQAVTQAQAALGYGIQEQGQQQAGFTSAGNLGNTAQGLLQSGLTSAGQLGQPSGNFPFVFDPLTGSYKTAGASGGSGTGITFNPQTDAQTFAQKVVGNQMGYNDALSALSYAGNAAEGYLTAAITALGGNPNSLKARDTGQSSLIGQLPTLQAAVNKAGGIQKTIENFLGNNPDINSNPDALRNAAQQWLSGAVVVDPRYTSLFNVYLPEYLNSITPVLGAAGNQTNYKTEIAQAFVNPNATSQSILSTIKNVGQAVNDAMANITSASHGGGTVAGGTSPGTTSGNSGNITWDNLGD